MDANTDVEREAIGMICPENRGYRLRAAICVSATLDYLFVSRWAGDGTAQLLEAAERTGVEVLREAAMRQPLTAKYKQAAGRNWAELRRTELTHERIADLEQTLEMERMGLLEPTA